MNMRRPVLCFIASPPLRSGGGPGRRPQGPGDRPVRRRRRHRHRPARPGEGRRGQAGSPAGHRPGAGRRGLPGRSHPGSRPWESGGQGDLPAGRLARRDEPDALRRRRSIVPLDEGADAEGDRPVALRRRTREGTGRLADLRDRPQRRLRRQQRGAGACPADSSRSTGPSAASALDGPGRHRRRSC